MIYFILRFRYILFFFYRNSHHGGVKSPFKFFATFPGAENYIASILDFIVYVLVAQKMLVNRD